MKPHSRYAKKLSRKRVFICLVVFFALLPVFSYLHEAGHALVCIADGNEAEISVNFSGGTTLCHGDVSNPFAYKISGGGDKKENVPDWFWNACSFSEYSKPYPDYEDKKFRIS